MQDNRRRAVRRRITEAGDAGRISRTGNGESRHQRARSHGRWRAIGLFAAAFSTLAWRWTPSPVYRFYNTKTGTHFYTISGVERD
jgi:hypothetical protein